MGCELRQLRAVDEIPWHGDDTADEPAFHVHGRLPAGARALLPARRHLRGAGVVPAVRARVGVFPAVLLELSGLVSGAAMAGAATPVRRSSPVRCAPLRPRRTYHWRQWLSATPSSTKPNTKIDPGNV